MISKRKIALSLLVGVPLALHGNPLYISGLERLSTLDYRINQDLGKQHFADYEIENPAHTQSSTKFELLRPRAISAADVAEPVQQQLPQPFSRSIPTTVLF